MAREVLVKKVAFTKGCSFGGSNSKYSVAHIRIDHSAHTIEVCEQVGAIHIESFVAFCAYDKDIREELVWAATEYQRKHSVWIDTSVGMSGRTDLYLRWSYGTGWRARVNAYTVAHWHLSCYDNFNEGVNDGNPMFVGDLLELLAYMIEGNEFLRYPGKGWTWNTVEELLTVRPKSWHMDRYFRYRWTNQRFYEEPVYREPVCGKYAGIIKSKNRHIDVDCDEEILADHD